MSRGLAVVSRRMQGVVDTLPLTALVFIAGGIARAVLVPITHGQDFVVWDLASQATLNGSNVYAHHPAYSGGPYSYFPLFLYVELPMQWLALHTGVSFTIMGKLPIVASDVATAVLIASFLVRRGFLDRAVAVGTALFFLNPLVVYNGAFYGRFDSVCLALLLLALRRWELGRGHTTTFAAVYALSVAAKTFPILLLPWLLLRLGKDGWRLVAVLGGTLIALSAPYLVTSPVAFFRDLIYYNASKGPGEYSWQQLLTDNASADMVHAAGYVLFGIFVLAIAYLARTVADPSTFLSASLLCSILVNKSVIEQYYIWTFPFLILMLMRSRAAGPAIVLVLLTGVGLVTNAFVDPLRPQARATSVVIAIIAVYGAAVCIRDSQRQVTSTGSVRAAQLIIRPPSTTRV
jgi:hypothetical protein